MEQNSQQEQKLKQPVDETDFHEFLKTLKAMCPGDYETPGSPLLIRADIAFEIFEKKNWNKEEFYAVLDRFKRKHTQRDWYPRTFLDHHEVIYGPNSVVM